MPPLPDETLENGKAENDLESAKFTKDKETVDVQPTAKLIGLTKEQLEQYRNDPFWKAIRYALFVAFWLVWLVMFVGAILIVVMSPKCLDVKWQNKATVYKIFSLAYNDADTSSDSNAGFGDFAGVKAKLGELKQMGVSAIWPTPILGVDKNKLTPEAIVDLDISEQLGGIEAFKDLVKSAHTKDLKVIVDLPLTVAAGDENWVQKKGIKNGVLPGAGDERMLNLKNPEIIDPLVLLALKFVHLGADGLNLADYGLLNGSSEDLEVLASKISQHSEMEHLLLFSEANNIVSSKINPIQPLFGNGEKKGLSALLAKLHENIDSLQSKYTKQKTALVNEDGGAGVDATGKDIQTVWRLGNLNGKGKRVDELFATTDASTPEQRQKLAHLASLVQLFIPGPVSVLYGEELAALSGKTSSNKRPNLIVYPWDSSVRYTKENQFFSVPQNATGGDYASQSTAENSPLNVFSKVTKLRQQNDFALGELTHSSLLGGDLVELYVLHRYPPNSAGYFALLVNWNSEAKTIAESDLPQEIQAKKISILASTDEQMSRRMEEKFGGDLAAYNALVLKVE